MSGPRPTPVGSHRSPKTGRLSTTDATSEDSPPSSKRFKSNTESEPMGSRLGPVKTFAGRKTRRKKLSSSDDLFRFEDDVQNLEIKQESTILSLSTLPSASTSLSKSGSNLNEKSNSSAESSTAPPWAPQPAYNDITPIVPDDNPLSRFTAMHDESMKFVKVVWVELEEAKEKLKDTTEQLRDTEDKNDRLKEKLVQAEEQERELTGQVIELTQQVQRTRELEKQVKELQMVAAQSKEGLIEFLNGLKGGLPTLERFVHGVAAS